MKHIFMFLRNDYVQEQPGMWGQNSEYILGRNTFQSPDANDSLGSKIESQRKGMQVRRPWVFLGLGSLTLRLPH